MIAFFGIHTPFWMNALSEENLLEDLKNRCNDITSITNIHKLEGNEEKLNKCEMILPIVENNSIELHRNNLSALMADMKTIEIFKCKKKFNEFVVENNLGKYIPKTYTQFYELAPHMDGMKPFIIKTPELYYGEGISISTIVKEKDFEENVIQEYLPNNEEYCSYIVADGGKIKFISTYKYIFNENYHIKNSETVPICVTSVDVCNKCRKVLEKFLLPIKYTGICNADYVIINGKVKLFEINPRFGGRILMSDHKKDLVDAMIALWNIQKDINKN
jgi:carbamoylphosphate synthase large subunit